MELLHPTEICAYKAQLVSAFLFFIFEFLNLPTGCIEPSLKNQNPRCLSSGVGNVRGFCVRPVGQKGVDVCEAMNKMVHGCLL